MHVVELAVEHKCRRIIILELILAFGHVVLKSEGRHHMNWVERTVYLVVVIVSHGLILLDKV